MYHPNKADVWLAAQELVKSITGIQDDETIRPAVDTVTGALCHPDCPIPNKKEIREHLEGLALKFHVHGFFRLSEGLESAMKDLLQSIDLESRSAEFTWNVLKLLRELSWKPMDHAHEEAIANRVSEPEATEKVFDWGAYLREGSSVLVGADDDDDSSDWSQLSDDEAEEAEAAPAAISMLFESPTLDTPKQSKSAASRTRRKKKAERVDELEQDSDEWSQLSNEDGRSSRSSDSSGPLWSSKSSSGSSSDSESSGDTPGDPSYVLNKTATDGSDRTSVSQLPSLPTTSRTSLLSHGTFPSLRTTSRTSLLSDGMIPAPMSGSSLLTAYPDPYVATTNFMSRPPPDIPQLVPASTPAASRPPPAVKAPNPQLLHVYHTAFKAEAELEDAVQSCDWFADSKMAAYPGPPDESVAVSYFSMLGDVDGISVLPEYQILRDVLWMLLDPTETRCFGRDEAGRYQPRPDVAIVYVGVLGLWTLLHGFCRYFDMIADFQSFRLDIHDLTADEGPPETYKSYWHALSRHLDVFTDAVAEIMGRVAKQESVNTLLSVGNELKPHLDQLGYLHRLHERAVCDWRTEENWFSAIRLLAVLYREVGQVVDSRHAHVPLDVYVKSLQPYLNIIHSWLSLDADVDFRDEFIIYRGSNMDSSMQDTWYEGVLVRPYVARLHGIAPPPSMLHQVVDQITLGCKSIYLLRLMDQLNTTKHSKSLYLDLLSSLSADFSLCSTSTGDSGYPSDMEEVTESTLLKLNAAMADKLVDPYLREAFGEFIGGGEGEGWRQTEEVEDKWTKLASALPRLSLRHHMMERSLSALVSALYRPLGRHVSAVLRDEMCLAQHLGALRKTFFLETADITGLFIQQLTLKMKDEPCWMYSHYLTSHLADCFSDPETEGSRFRVAVDNAFRQTDVMKAVDGIEISYTVEWPLSLLVKPNLPLYNEIFRLLLKLKWAVSSLEGLRFDEQKPAGQATKCVRRLTRWQTLRFWLLNAVTGAHNFTMSHVVHSFGPELDDLIQHGEDFDQLVTAHCKYLRTIHQTCVNVFQGSALKAQFDHLLVLAQCLVDDWRRSNKPSYDSRLERMEGLYSSIHYNIGRHLANFVPKDSRINIDSLLSVFYYPLKPTLGRVQARK